MLMDRVEDSVVEIGTRRFEIADSQEICKHTLMRSLVKRLNPVNMRLDRER